MFGRILWRHRKKNKVERHLRDLEERGYKEPNNLELQIRIGDLLAKTGMTGRAVTVYRKTAVSFARRKQFRQALGLNSIILRLDPSEENKHWHRRVSQEWLGMEENSKEETSSKMLVSETIPRISSFYSKEKR